MGLPPTQRLSQVCGILGVSVYVDDSDDSRSANTVFSTERVSHNGYHTVNASIHNYPASCTSRSNPCNLSIRLSLRKRDDIVSAGDIPPIIRI